MAAPCSTFRGLLLLRRLAPVRVAAAPPRRGYGVRVSESGESVTHTGQVYEENDYRKVRFVARQKEVNETFAIDLIAEQPVNKVESRVISCDGGGGALGHPKVTKIQKLEHVVTVDFSLNRNITTERSSLHALQNSVRISVLKY
uniref:Uncharacterized protein n=1 Tax=Gopherus agassizii TaxID=38772 RepID=A0A452IBC6_9SAUR